MKTPLSLFVSRAGKTALDLPTEWANKDGRNAAVTNLLRCVHLHLVDTLRGEALQAMDQYDIRPAWFDTVYVLLTTKVDLVLRRIEKGGTSQGDPLPAFRAASQHKGESCPVKQPLARLFASVRSAEVNGLFGSYRGDALILGLGIRSTRRRKGVGSSEH